MTKVFDRVFHEETIGFAIIGMLILACLYQYTQSPLVQKIGLTYGVLIIVLLVGFLIKLIIDLLIIFYKYIKTIIK